MGMKSYGTDHKLNANGADIYYEEHGTGSETIVFAHGLLWSGRMFGKQVHAFQDRYRCITFDFRGQGQSEITSSGYDMDTLTEDAAALIAALEVICQKYSTGAPPSWAGRMRMSYFGRRELRSKRFSTSLIAALPSFTPFS